MRTITLKNIKRCFFKLFTERFQKVYFRNFKLNWVHLTASPSRAQGLPFWRYFPWFCLFFWPPSANLHNKGSVGTEKATHERELSDHSREQKHWALAPPPTISGSYNIKHSTHQALPVESWWICHWNAELWPRTSQWTPSWNAIRL